MIPEGNPTNVHMAKLAQVHFADSLRNVPCQRALREDVSWRRCAQISAVEMVSWEGSRPPVILVEAGQ